MLTAIIVIVCFVVIITVGLMVMLWKQLSELNTKPMSNKHLKPFEALTKEEVLEVLKEDETLNAVRWTEDIIMLLIQKNILHESDFNSIVINRIKYRQQLRGRLSAEDPSKVKKQ